jgi:preprotein translocase subunit SecF
MEKNWYDKYYKVMFVPPVLLMLLSVVYIFSFYQATGDFFYKDASLAGGTTITLQLDKDPKELESLIKLDISDVSIREIKDLTTGSRLALIIESSVEPQVLTQSIEKAIGLELDPSFSTVEFTGSSLSNSFHKQLLIALISAFVLMTLVIFFLFRSFVPSIAIVFAAFSNIVVPLAIVNYLGISLSAAGIAAFLMTIGYSVDTNILLTTRVLKNRQGTVNQRIFSSFKTGSFMTLTALIAVLPAFIFVTGLPETFRQIFFILSLGLTTDLFNTWLTNTSLIKWYAKKRGLQ